VREHNDNIARIKKRIEGIGRKEGLVMSEHSLCRYLQRVETIPIEEVEKRVITEELNKIYSVLGDGEFPIGIGEHTCVIKSGIIITIK